MPIDARLGLLLGLIVVALAGLLSAQPRSSPVSRPETAIRSSPTGYATDWARVPPTGPEAAPGYRVQEGDTLASIAEKYYGDRHKSGELFRMNRDTISDPVLLVPGTLLRVPGPADAK